MRDVAATTGIATLLIPAILRHDGRALAFGVLASGLAATVATFQVAVFTSFLAAGAAAPTALAADGWISDRGVECFDFPMPIAEDYRTLVLAELPGARVRRVAFGFAGWIGPGGQRGNVALIGVDGLNLPERGFAADASDRARLGLATPGAPGSIGYLTLNWAREVNGYATFLGAPYVLTGFDTALAAAGTPGGQVAFLAIDFPAGKPRDLAARLARIEARYPAISARTDSDFRADSSAYWQRKTGAGAAILLAAILASLLMGIILMNSVGRFVQRRAADFVSMVGHGASDDSLRTVVAAMTGVMLAGAALLAAFATPLITLAARPWLPWVALKPADGAAAAGIALLTLVMALAASRRELKGFSPDVLFRS